MTYTGVAFRTIRRSSVLAQNKGCLSIRDNRVDQILEMLAGYY